jgi:hypothetical protein
MNGLWKRKLTTMNKFPARTHKLECNSREKQLMLMMKNKRNERK